jgi:hypothetical protein
MRYRLICSNKEGSFSLKDDEIPKLIEARKKNQPAIFREGAVLNWNMYSGVVVDYERVREIGEANWNNTKYESPSPFAKFLSPKLKMFKDNKQSEIAEEVSKEERDLTNK